MEESPEPESSIAEGPTAGSELPEGAIAHDPGRSWIGVWAFVLALLGLGPLLVIGSVLGMVLGRVAIRRSATGAVRGGRGLATAAFVIGLATLALITLSAATYALVLAFGPA